MKVLIAEDEYYARKRLVKLVREWDSSVVVTADVETGIEALNSISREQPDFVLTDIRMPQMDGLELSRYIMEHHPSVFVVIISGYADFEYAREAIEYHVKGYLLKPINKDDLYQLLEQLRNKWENSRRERQQYDATRQKLVSVNQIWKLTCAIYEQYSLDDSLSELLKVHRKPTGYWVIVFKCYSHLEERHDGLLQGLLKSEPTRDGFGFFNPVVKNEWVGICFSFSSGDALAFAGPSEITKRMICNLKENLHDQFSIGVSRFKRTDDCLSKAYREAKYSLAQHLCCSGDRLFEYVSPMGSVDYEWKEEVETKLLQDIKAGQAAAVKSRIHTIFSKVGEDRQGSLQYLQYFYSRIDSLIRSQLDELMIQELPNREIDEFASLDQLVEELAALAELLCDRQSIDKLGDRKNQELIHDMLTYVKENYACEISLDFLAKHRYYLNTSYLSRLFKSKTGQGFSEFLTACRMQRAKELIKTNWFTVSEIAGLVGYSKPSHFIHMFKKYVGETPGNYKNRLTEE